MNCIVAHLTERIGIIVVALVKRVVGLQPSHYPQQAHLRTLLFTLASEASGLCTGMARIS